MTAKTHANQIEIHSCAYHDFRLWTQMRKGTQSRKECHRKPLLNVPQTNKANLPKSKHHNSKWHSICAKLLLRNSQMAVRQKPNNNSATAATLTVCCAVCFVLFRFFHFYRMCVRLCRHTCELRLGISFIRKHTHTQTRTLFYREILLLLLTANPFDVILLWLWLLLLLFLFFFVTLLSTIKINTLGCVAIWLQLNVRMIERANRKKKSNGTECVSHRACIQTVAIFFACICK